MLIIDVLSHLREIHIFFSIEIPERNDGFSTNLIQRADGVHNIRSLLLYPCSAYWGAMPRGF